MYTTYHFSSAQELSSDILDSIKATFKMKPITIIVEEEEYDNDLTLEMKTILDERLKEEEAVYLTSGDFINQLDKKYGI